MIMSDIEWKNLMSTCLVETEILKNNENEKYLRLDPNLIMELRHKKVKDAAKMYQMPQSQIHSEALLLLRVKNHKIMQRKKEGRMVEKEIARLKRTLDNDRFLIEKKLDDTTITRTKYQTSPPKFIKYHANQWKRLEFCDDFNEVHMQLGNASQVRSETKMNETRISSEMMRFSSMQDFPEEFLGPMPSLEGSMSRDDFEHIVQDSGADEGKNEIMRKFFHKNSDEVSQEWENDLIKRLPEIQKRINFRRLRHAWVAWKIHTQELKHRQKEQRNYKNKIESFLSRFEEKVREKKEISATETNYGKGSYSIKAEERLIDVMKARQNESNNKKAEKNLKKLMEEVKISHAEACKKLREITQTKQQNAQDLSHLVFLKRMEKRREERLKRWEEIRERKRKLEEEKENAQKLKQDEEERKEEENRRKKAEESKMKEALEQQKKERKAQEREIFRHKAKLAEEHYGKYLLRSYGLRPWVALLKFRASQRQRAVAFFERKLTLKTFNRLLAYVREEIRSKIRRADEFHERMLKRNLMNVWIERYKEKIKQEQAAADWNEFKTVERMFKKWLNFTQDEQLEYLNKRDVALLHYERKTLLRYLNKLRDYPKLEKLERVKENRKWKWRQRVKEILPDYQPVEIY